LERDWESGYKKELERAVRARSEGNEGMGRVCARRAAGILIGEYFRRRGVFGLPDSAYDRLTLFNDLPDVNEEFKEISSHLLMKVNKEHHLPVKADLISDVIWLRDHLLNGGID
jgi:hypothetical protein